MHLSVVLRRYRGINLRHGLRDGITVGKLWHPFQNL